MNKTGYVIAKNKGLAEFFTSSSAYDRPRWVSIAEATTYPTAELAERASTKLYKSSGAYEARVVPVTQLVEVRSRNMSFEEQPYDDSDPTGIMPDGAVGNEGMEADTTTDGESKMVAKKQGTDPSVDPEADDEPGLADMERPDDAEDDADVENIVDRQLGDDDLDDGTVGMSGEDDIEGELPEFDDTDTEFSSLAVRESASPAGILSRRYDTVRPKMSAVDAAMASKMLKGYILTRRVEFASNLEKVLNKYEDSSSSQVNESAMPKKPQADGAPANNKTTADKLNPPPEIQYKDPSSKADKPDTDLTKTTAEPHEDKVKVPAAVLKELRDVIGEFERVAKFANTRDDAKAEFCMTVVEAFRELEEYLKMGTVESMKLAQVHYTSLMNAISNHLPEPVKKFIMMGGRKPTLKDLFDSKRGI